MGAIGISAQPVQITRGAYLQVVTENSVIVRWRTDVPTTSRVDYGTTTSYGKSINDPAVTSEHVVKISGLQPASHYFYAIGSRSQLLQSGISNNFYTAPTSGSITPVRIWVTGDFGTGTQTQADVRDAYTNFSQSPTHLWIWLGDNAYSSGLDSEYQVNVFNVYPEQLKQFPVFPAPGNHDYAQTGYLSNASLTTSFPYFSIFTVPENGEAGGVASGTPKYYSYNYSNIHFISLDSYGTANDPGSAMYNWLSQDLAANTQRWTIVYFHHPPFTKGTHDSDREIELIDIRTHIIPLLENYHVDLVLSGHSHSNERSYLIKGHYGPSTSFDSSNLMSIESKKIEKRVPYNGTVYAICGTSGHLEGNPQADAPMPCMYFNDFISNCSMVIEVDGDLLIAKYLSSYGIVVDEFNIRKLGPGEPLNDWQASCEISYHQGDDMLYFSLFLTEDNSVSAGMYNMLGEKIADFDKFPEALKKGFHVLSTEIENSKFASGIYTINFEIGEQQFSKKIFISFNRN